MSMMNISDSNFVKKLNLLAMVAIVAGIALVGLGVAMDYDLQRLLASYLVGYTFVMGITITAIFFSALQYLTNAGWSAMVRRISEFMATPWLLLGLIPLLLDVHIWHQLYHWADPHVLVEGDPHYDPILAGKSAFLNPEFFTARIIGYCLLWIWMYKYIVGNSYKQDEAGSDFTPTKKNFVRSAPFVLIYALTISFAGFDLVMSVDPHWFSTIFGVYFFAGNFVATIGLIAIFAILLNRAGLLKVNQEHFHHLGKLLFAFNVFWTYIGFSQFFLYWYGNIPEETLFYIHRLHHGWEVFFYLLIVLHFIVPFVLLISQAAKRNTNILLAGSILLVVMHFVDLSWFILPQFSAEAFRFGPLEIGMWILCFGILLMFVGKRFAGKKPYVAANDPYMQESVELLS